MATTIALLGDYSDEVTAHRAIPIALQLAASSLAIDIKYDWIHSTQINVEALAAYHGIWCVPASPYADAARVITAIQYARENHTPFLGTCGGYQHATLEFAQHVLGFAEAGNVEENPDTSMPLINALMCALREKSGQIKIKNPSQMYSIVQSELIEGQYQCGFGVNKDYLAIFENTELNFTGFDLEDDPRAFELHGHPFYIGTAFQPERSALTNKTHPLIVEFVRTASNNT